MIENTNRAKALVKTDVSRWINMNEQVPPDIVKEYVVRNINGEEFECEWYEGESFECCSGGHWSDLETGEEVLNITHWFLKSIC